MHIMEVIAYTTTYNKHSIEDVTKQICNIGLYFHCKLSNRIDRLKTTVLEVSLFLI